MVLPSNKQWAEVKRESLMHFIFRTAEDVLKLPKPDLEKMIHLADHHCQTTAEGDYLTLRLRMILNPESVQAIDAPPVSTYDTITSWEYDDMQNLFIITRAVGGKAFYPRKSVVKVPKADIEEL
ncbi:hypothetical protein L1987_58453 [Smallanthus sonchifolius]|uniref:Uncharacterized protein n=1 Tax=Smallanthus sonchifolius TaxID=185202 RepID=A0ACB9DFK4_9ASTR|nr:hypothetical protein L1987_58453 [Smallanthus sonchifolius]